MANNKTELPEPPEQRPWGPRRLLHRYRFHFPGNAAGMRFFLAHIHQRTAPMPLFLLLSAAALVALDITQVDARHYVESQRDLFLAINGSLAAHPFFWLNVTQLGDALVLFPLLSFLLFKSPRAWAALFATAPIAGIFSSLAKSHFAVPRPAAVLTPDQIAIAGPVLTAHNSLPSGHTITILFCILANTRVEPYALMKKGSGLHKKARPESDRAVELHSLMKRDQDMCLWRLLLEKERSLIDNKISKALFKIKMVVDLLRIEYRYLLRTLHMMGVRNLRDI